MRNISFHLTQPQILAQTKTVTRRVGWHWLREHFAQPNPPEILLQPIVKGQGIPKGGKVQPLGPPIRILSARLESLMDITQEDVHKEGFPDFTPDDFIQMFCQHMGGLSPQGVTRIEFEYT